MAYGDRQANARGGIGWKAVAGITSLILIGLLILAGWIVTQFDLWPGNSQPEQSVAAEKSAEGNSSNADPKGKAAANPQGKGTEAVAQKVEEIADRLSQIDIANTDQGGYSARADAVVTALSVRRAIESGAALGFTESQLRLRFGSSHPQAVAAIQAAAAQPVTLTNLRDDLARNGTRLVGRGDSVSLWDRLQTELKELFVLRERGTPSTAPSQILQRAEQHIANGDVRSAIEDIEKLPDNTAKQAWLVDARRYLAARDALDAIERSALSTPANVPALPPATPQTEESAEPAPDAPGQTDSSSRTTQSE